MLNYILIAVQILVLLGIGILLWQIWRLLHNPDIPDDEPLGEERGKYLTTRLTWICICAAVEAALQIASAILRFLEII